MFFPNNKTTCWRHCEIVCPPNDLVFAYSADLFKPFVCWCLVPFVYFGSVLACPRSACSCNSLFCSPIRWVSNHQIKMFVRQSAHIFQTIDIVNLAFHFGSSIKTENSSAASCFTVSMCSISSAFDISSIVLISVSTRPFL